MGNLPSPYSRLEVVPVPTDIPRALILDGMRLQWWGSAPHKDTEWYVGGGVQDWAGLESRVYEVRFAAGKPAKWRDVAGGGVLLDWPTEEPPPSLL
jgi:hypothetical protein